MIRDFADKATRDIYDGVDSRSARKLPNNLYDKARRLLDQINAAPAVMVLKTPPGNRLEKLHGNLAGFFSVRINDQWRIIFKWKKNDALNVKITDYH